MIEQKNPPYGGFFVMIFVQWQSKDMNKDILNSAIVKLRMCYVNDKNDNCQTLANGTGFFWKNNSTGKNI